MQKRRGVNYVGEEKEEIPLNSLGLKGKKTKAKGLEEDWKGTKAKRNPKQSRKIRLKFDTVEENIHG